MNRNLASRLGPQQFVGGLFGLVAAIHFAFWTNHAGNPLRTSLQRGEVAAVPGAVVSYLSTHPAYALLFVVGVAVVVRATLE